MASKYDGLARIIIQNVGAMLIDTLSGVFTPILPLLCATGIMKGLLGIAAPVSGYVIPLSEVRDEAFSSGVLGKGLAIVPAEGKVYAPCDGQVTALFPTGHAIGITAANKAELLLHIGMDTVRLEGKYFSPKVEAGANVHTGDLLLEFDLEKIKEAGFERKGYDIGITGEDEKILAEHTVDFISFSYRRDAQTLWLYLCG